MTAITLGDRALIVRYIDRATRYDPSTVIVHRAGNLAGTVSAILDANKTFNGPETDRHYLGHTENVLADARDWLEGLS